MSETFLPPDRIGRDSLRPAVRLSVALSLLALGVGLWIEILFYGHPPGISFFLWAVACVLAALIAARVSRVRVATSAWVAMAGALVFAGATFLRQEPLTVFLSIMLAIFFLTLIVRVFRFGRLGRFGWIDMAVAFLWPPLEAWIRPWPIAAQAWSGTVREHGSRRVIFSILRGLLLALPFLVVFIALLSAADLVFGDYVRQALRWIDLDKLIDWTGRLLVILVGATFTLGALAAALRPPGDRKLIGEDPPLVPPFLGFTETAIVLSLVVLVFLSFVAIQFAYLFGGQANIHAAGYTYAEYARRGFGELVAVACLSLGMIFLLAAVTRIESPRQRRTFLFLCSAVVILVTVMLVSAYQRLVLYEQAYGFSRLRTYTHLAIVWLAVALTGFLVLLFLGRMRRLAPLALALACGFTLSLVLVDVDDFIVDRNAGRFAASGGLDVVYLASLSDDAVPGLVSLVPRTTGEKADALLADLACRRHAVEAVQKQFGWPSAHASRIRALEALSTIESRLAAFPVYLDYHGVTGRPSYVVKTPGGYEPCPATFPD
ncbi:MAG TPA: DUF4173 domain-containing protein [Anaerolineales bacterium]|nr:DUF4173 domain-containing protein [Anaerolineales bacterium]